MANHEEWRTRPMRLLFQKAFGQKAHRGNAPLHQVCANYIWFAPCLSTITPLAGGFNVLGVKKPSRNDRMWRAVISIPSTFHILFRTSFLLNIPPSSTGASPHGCDFCDDRFKDPSKRHKHMLRSHGYRPGESRKKFRSEESAQGQSVHESLEPWKGAAAQ